MHTVICGTPGFVGVVGACTCNRYQALFPPPSRPGYEAGPVRLENFSCHLIRMYGQCYVSLFYFPMFVPACYSHVIKSRHSHYLHSDRKEGLETLVQFSYALEEFA